MRQINRCKRRKMKCLEHCKQLLFCLIFRIAQQLQLPAASLQTGRGMQRTNLTEGICFPVSLILGD